MESNGESSNLRGIEKPCIGRALPHTTSMYCTRVCVQYIGGYDTGLDSSTLELVGLAHLVVLSPRYFAPPRSGGGGTDAHTARTYVQYADSIQEEEASLLVAVGGTLSYLGWLTTGTKYSNGS